MAMIIPVASGKGGTGKTLFTSNLGLSLAAKGKQVTLIDLDLGASNLHTILGIKNKHPSIGDFIYRHIDSLKDIIIQTGYEGVSFIPGDALFPGTANLKYSTKNRIIKEIKAIQADFILLDLGSGSSFNTIDFFLVSRNGIVVTTPETTSILNAYSFLKTTLYRLLFRSFPAKSREREIILEFVAQKNEGTGISFLDLLNIISSHNPASGKKAREQVASLYPRIVINNGKSREDLNIGLKLRDIITRNLGISLEYLGFLFHNQEASHAILKRTPLYSLDPQSRYSESIDKVANKLIRVQETPSPELYEAEEDVEKLFEQFNAVSNPVI
ncbi:MAG: P-loop NTPase [Spirochaetales bacterium]|nr:P-loop NTPase [Spirochaetales bacterium]